MAGTAIPATRPIPTGAPTKVPNCHISFFFLDQGFFPQNVQPEGLEFHRNIFIWTLEIIMNKNMARNSPEVVQFGHNFHTKPAKLGPTHGTGHMIAGPIIHLDNEHLAPRTRFHLFHVLHPSMSIRPTLPPPPWSGRGLEGHLINRPQSSSRIAS